MVASVQATRGQLTVEERATILKDELRAELIEARRKAHCFARLAQAEQLIGQGDLAGALKVLREGKARDALSLAFDQYYPDKGRAEELIQGGNYQAAIHTLRCRLGG